MLEVKMCVICRNCLWNAKRMNAQHLPKENKTSSIAESHLAETQLVTWTSWNSLLSLRVQKLCSARQIGLGVWGIKDDACAPMCALAPGG